MAPALPKKLRSVNVVRTPRLRLAMQMPLKSAVRRLFSGTT